MEIGAYFGVGTVKLAIEARKRGKVVYVIDTFDPGQDYTPRDSGAAAGMYTSGLLRGRSQWEVYTRNTRHYAANIVTLRGDSREVAVPPALKLCFAFIDGKHTPEYIRSDFDVAWSRIVPGGAIGFDDYGHELPEAMQTIDRLILENARDISEVWTIKPKEIFLRKAARPREI